MSSKLDEVKAKLRKLIAKEESSRALGNLEEAEAFASKIQELLLEYEISIEELGTKHVSDPINPEWVDLSELIGRNESTWVWDLYRTGAENNFCRVIYPYSFDSHSITLIGNPTNREFVHYFVNQLVSKIRELARLSYSGYVKAWTNRFGTDEPLGEDDRPEKRNTYIRGFLAGAVMGIRNRLYKDREEAKKNTPQVNALVLSKDGEMALYWATNFPEGSLKKTSVKGTSSNDGYGAGIVAGSKVPINKGVSGKRGMGGTKLLN